MKPLTNLFSYSLYQTPAFRDNQRSLLYLYQETVDIEQLRLQKSEIESVIWMDYQEALQAIRENTIKHCIYEEEFQKVGKALGL